MNKLAADPKLEAPIKGIYFHSTQIPNFISLNAMPRSKSLTKPLMLCTIFTTSP
jgi:hypothetical protein